MNKKIKVIELLNIVARGKDIPKKIKVCLRKDGEQMPDYYIFNDYGFYENSKEESFVEDWLNNTMKLNEEVEILEDEEEIDIKMFEQEWFEQHRLVMNEVECDLALKTNEIIDYLLKLNKRINKED